MLPSRSSHTKATAALAAAAAAAADFTDGKINEKMTISIGMAEYPLNAEDLEGFIKFADDAMYQAKQTGRNCIR